MSVEDDVVEWGVLMEGSESENRKQSFPCSFAPDSRGERGVEL